MIWLWSLINVEVALGRRPLRFMKTTRSRKLCLHRGALVATARRLAGGWARECRRPSTSRSRLGSLPYLYIFHSLFFFVYSYFIIFHFYHTYAHAYYTSVILCVLFCIIKRHFTINTVFEIILCTYIYLLIPHWRVRTSRRPRQCLRKQKIV